MTAARLEPIQDRLRRVEREADDAAWAGRPHQHLDREAAELRRLLDAGEAYIPNF